MTTRTETYTIPANRTGVFLRNVRKLNKKAATLRADGNFECSFGDTFVRNVEVDESGRKVAVEFVEATITGPDFSIAGYKLVTMADFDDPAAPTFHDFNESSFGAYNEITTECDHCRKARARRKMFVLENIESGEFVTIGKSCLKDYLGYTIADALKGATFWAGIADDCDSLYGELARGYDEGESVDEVLATAVAAIREYGYRSRAQADEECRAATADIVREMMQNNYKPSDEEKAEAEVVRAWADNEYKFDADDADKNNSFVLNISNALEAGRVPRKLVGLVACLPAMKARAEAKAAREAANGKSEWFGKVKERIEAEVEVVGVNYIDGYYGTTTIYTMLVDGNIAKWFASRDSLDKGEKYTVKMTVKDHDEYNGTKQTVVTRVAVQ